MSRTLAARVTSQLYPRDVYVGIDLPAAVYQACQYRVVLLRSERSFYIDNIRFPMLCEFARTTRRGQMSSTFTFYHTRSQPPVDCIIRPRCWLSPRGPGAFNHCKERSPSPTSTLRQQI